MPFRAIAPRRLYQQVAEQIAAMVGAGEIGAGERLPAERDLAGRLGVSRPTVREAMVALEIAGLVEVKTGSGVYVRPAPASHQAGADRAAAGGPLFEAGPGPFELVSARALVEPEIAAAAARSASADDVAALDATIEELAAAPDHRASLEADRRFHALLAGATGNGVLVEIVQDLWAGMSSPLFEALSSRSGLPDTLDMTLSDHRAILDAVRARAPAAARRTMRRHLRNVRNVLDKGRA